MSTACQIVVCGSIVPDPLPTLEPVNLICDLRFAIADLKKVKSEITLPAVLDPWAAHAV